jgi:hypothetical protein
MWRFTHHFYPRIEAHPPATHRTRTGDALAYIMCVVTS